MRFATLAANSHNSQPWKFSVAEDRITIHADFARRCPAVDPDDHHLFVSLGCATENLVHAAEFIGLKAEPVFTDDTIVIRLTATAPKQSPLFSAITQRQCTRASYDGKPVDNISLRLLERACVEPGVSAIAITDRMQMRNVGDYVEQGNSAQMRDKAFMTELVDWMRFSKTDAAAKMDGLFTAASGNPALPSWLGRPLLRFFFTESGENKKYREHIASSAGIMVISSDADDRRHWVAAGRACQRFALQATALGLKYAFINQPVEVPELRPQFAAYLGLGARRPDLVLRFGYGPSLPRSLRRPPEQVTI
ncbi:MAG: Tat pathway signal protein [Pseudolabrys sp.]|nr:Tat pathway signal protein [Pseudolabrys sp.]MDP2297679.1 Tat pathway signal protein [Pseudolabrys sp.]